MRNLKFFIKVMMLTFIMVGFADARELPFGKVPTGDEWIDNANDTWIYNRQRYSMDSLMPVTKTDSLTYNNAQDKHGISWSSKDYGGVTYGDFLITGASILKDDPKTPFTSQYSDGSVYVNDKSWSLNSATAELKGTSFKNSRGVDVNVTADDIIYARLYWQGMIFDRKHYNESAHTYGDFYDAIKDYRKVTIMGGDGIEHRLTADIGDTYVAYSYSNDNDSSYGKGYRMWYSTSVDVTDIVKNSFDLSKEFTVGNINTTKDYIKYPNAIGGSTSARYNNDFFPLYQFQTSSWTTLRYASYGGWSLIVVYEDKETQGAKKRFDPKAITIYDGFTFLWSGGTDGLSADMTLDFDGFYTPMDSNFDAKMGYFMTTITGAAGGAAGLKIKKNNATINRTSDWNNPSKAYDIEDTTLNKAGYQYNFSITYLDKNKKQQHLDSSKKTNRFVDIDTYDLTGKLEPEQTNTEINLKVTSKLIPGTNSVQTGRSIISMVAFSTDLYVPYMCYYSTVYNKAGASSRGKDGFIVTPNEILRNQVYFSLEENSTAEYSHGLTAEYSHGLVVVPDLSSTHLSYIDNTTKISNPKTHDDSTVGFDSMKAIIDNTPDEEGKQYNRVLSADQFNLYVGVGAGDPMPGGITGGTLKRDGARAYVEFQTKIDGFYIEPIYKYSFSLGGAGLRFELDMPECPTESGDEEKNIVKVVPLDGIGVVNENYGGKGDDRHLYTQIANKPFNVKMAYDNNITKFADDGALDKFLGDDEMGKILCEGKPDCNEKDELEKWKKEREENLKKIAEAKTNLNEKKAELVQRESELTVAQENLSKAQKDLTKAQKDLTDAKKALAADPENEDLKEKVRQAEQKLNDAQKDFEDKKKIVEDAKQAVEAAKQAVKTAEDELKAAEGKLDETEKPFKDEFDNRFSKLDGKFVVTLTRAEHRDKDVSKTQEFKDFKAEKLAKGLPEPTVCDYITEGSDEYQYNFYYKFSDEVKKSKVDDTVTVLNPDKDKDHLYPTYDLFAKNENKGVVDIDGIMIGLARKDYTFAVSYIPSGFETLTTCQYNCVIDNTKDGIRDREKISECQQKCENQQDENYEDEVYRINFCNTDEFSIRPAYFKKEKSINPIYIAGDDELKDDVEDSFYPVDANGNYVLGYDAILQPPETNKEKSPTIFSQLSTDVCLSENINNIYLDTNTEEIFYENNLTKLANWTKSVENGGKGLEYVTLWDRDENSANNLFVNFSCSDFDEPNKCEEYKDKRSNNDNSDYTDEIEFYNNDIKTKADLENGKEANSRKTYAEFSLDGLGDINYFNIGYAKMRLADMEWTKHDASESPRGCIDGNYTYIPTTKKTDTYNANQVGCYIGVELPKTERDQNRAGIGSSVLNKLIDQDLVFKFKHSDIRISIEDFKDALDVNGHKYTYFHGSDRNQTRENVNPMAADLAIKTIAFVETDINDDLEDKEIITTLYNKNCYARDITFGLDFEFDCDDDEDKVGGVNRCGELDDDEVDKEYCKNNVLDSRCYELDGNLANLYNGIEFVGRGGIENYEINATKYSVNITEGDRKFDIDKGKDVNLRPLQLFNKLREQEREDRNPSRLPIFTVKESSFMSGQNDGSLGVNFQRDRNNTINPKVVYAEDFIENKAVKIEEEELVTDKVVGDYDLNTKDIKSDDQEFEEYERAGGINNGTGAGHFYYGYLNSQDRIYGNIIPINLNTEQDVKVFSMIFTDSNISKTQTIESLSLFYRGSDVDKYKYVGVLPNNEDRENFYQNPAEFDTANARAERFVSNPNNGAIRGTRDWTGMVQEDNMQFEKLGLSSSQAGIYNIEVYVPGWLVYDQYGLNKARSFNEFTMIFGDLNSADTGAQWGGTGGTKSGDAVGRYLDEDEAKKGLVNTPGQGKRINW